MHPDRGAFRPVREQVHAKMRHHYVDEEEDKVEDYDYDKEWRVCTGPRRDYVRLTRRKRRRRCRSSAAEGGVWWLERPSTAGRAMFPHTLPDTG